MRKKPLLVLATVVLVALGAWSLAASASDSQTGAAREATAKFQNLDVTRAAGYGLFKDINGIACIAMPGMGGMGFHYVNGDIVGNPDIDLRRPEALVYARQEGRLRLAALEYIVIKRAWDARHSSPPALFGQTFNLTLSPNRYGLPDFYSLHAWLFKNNPV